MQGVLVSMKLDLMVSLNQSHLSDIAAQSTEPSHHCQRPQNTFLSQRCWESLAEQPWSFASPTCLPLAALCEPCGSYLGRALWGAGAREAEKKQPQTVPC